MSRGFSSGFIAGAFVSLVAAGGASILTPLKPVDPAGTAQVDLSTPAGSGFNSERSESDPILPKTEETKLPEVAAQPDPGDSGFLAPTADTTSAAQPVAGVGITMPSVELGDEDVALLAPSSETAPVKQPSALGVPMPAIDDPVATIPTNRLPSIETPTIEIEPPVADITPDADIRVQQPEATLTQETSNAALLRNAVSFSNPENKPLLSIILLDAGEEGLERDVLLSFSFPVTFAVDVARGDAFEASQAFTTGGFEVVAMAPSDDSRLEVSENSGDIETVLAGYFARVPQAVGLIDKTDATLQQTPTLADQVIDGLKASGHALVTYDVGLNSTNQKALREGLAASTVFRVLDGEHESGTVMKRYLDRAVLEAVQDGHVIMLGHTYPETITALFSWALSAKSSRVALAPLSAVLLEN